MLFLLFHINVAHLIFLERLKICTGKRNCRKANETGRMTSVSGTHKIFKNQKS